MVEARSLAGIGVETLHEAFVEAFSDYVVPLAPPLDRFEEMMRRRGFVGALSAGVFDGGKLVAFTLNGVEGTHAYDTGTGVVPSHRRQRLARRTMELSFELLRSHGCVDYTLEVLEENRGAESLYRQLGFEEQRRLQCWAYDGEPTWPPPPSSPAAVDPAFCDVEPSWQNSLGSIARSGDARQIIGGPDCYAVVFPESGDLAQLAVRPDNRRRGRGSIVLQQAQAVARKPLRIMNVDDRDEGIARFLENAGARRTVRQIEMRRAF